MKWINILLSCSLLFLFSCDENRVYEKNKSISDNLWFHDDKVSFEVNIADTTAMHTMYVNVRHANWYPYRNLWVLIHTTYPSGEEKTDKVELTLGDEKDWYGDGMGDIWDIKIPIQDNLIFPESGTYKLEIEQNMREEKLPGIMDIGIRIDKPAAEES